MHTIVWLCRWEPLLDRRFGLGRCPQEHYWRVSFRAQTYQSFRSTPELTTDSPVNNSVVKMDSPPVPPVLTTTADTDDQTDTLKCLQQHYGLSMIDALDLALDRRIAVWPQLRPLLENAVIFRSSER